MKLRLLSFVVFILSASSIFGQNVDKIIDNYFENTGGIDNWKNLKNMKIRAVMNQGEMQLNMTIYQNRENMQRADVEVQGKTIVQAYDGETGWMINPLMGSEAPQKMPPEMVEQMKEEKFESDLLDYQTKGHTVELDGTEIVEGTETYKLKLTKENGDVEYYFLDKEYFVPIMQRRVVKFGPGKGQETETYISDYQEVGEFMMPFFIDTRMNGQSVMKMTIEEYVLNGDIDNSIFTMPETGSNSNE